MSRSAQLLLVLTFAGASLAGCADTEAPEETQARSPAGTTDAQYVGASVCADCHADETAAWRGSHHDLAMQVANPETVLGDFDAASFSHNGIDSRFERRDSAYVVVTDGPDGELGEFPVEYTFGVYPLQQYLARLPNGRLQALPLSWDSRREEEGGQRWFHVYGDDPVPHTDPLHWTRLSQNWETQCADCHSTSLVKQYDVATDSFDTSFAELNVACEACHGPGSSHVAWAGAPDDSSAKGLVNRFNERADVAWILDPDTGNSRRSQPRRTSTEIDSCAPCHSRRSLIGTATPSESFLDHYQPALIGPPLYHGDGQVLDEVYVYGSFLQSRMYQEGVTCSDCHEPHSLQLRAPGSQVCLQCHDAEKFTATSHHLHETGMEQVNCIDCHMPATTFMQVDVRNDHSFRVPRAVTTAESGAPLACLQCHADRDADWAITVLAEAGVQPESEAPHWSRRMAAVDQRPMESRDLLLSLVVDQQVPPLIRASAMARLNLANDSLGATVVTERLRSSDPLIRWGAARALQTANPVVRAQYGLDLMDDPVKAVRLTAATVLAPLGPDVIPPDKQAAYQAVLDEYVATQLLSAERAESHMNIGNIERFLGRPERGEAAYRTAIKVNEFFVPAYVNLADLYREQGRETAADQLLREGLEKLPGQSGLRHALGLSLVRQARMDDALIELKAAADSTDATPRFALAYGLALDAQEGPELAGTYLESAIERFGDDPSLLAALANIYQRSGNLDAARELAERLRR